MFTYLKHTTISNLLLEAVRKLMPSKTQKTPNKGTIEVLNESRENKLESYDTLEDFWKAMGIDPDA